MTPLLPGQGYQSSHSPSQTCASTCTEFASVPITVWAEKQGLHGCDVPLMEKLIYLSE